MGVGLELGGATHHLAATAAIEAHALEVGHDSGHGLAQLEGQRGAWLGIGPGLEIGLGTGLGLGIGIGLGLGIGLA